MGHSREPLYSYGYTFNGVALELTAAEAEQLRTRRGVSKVWADRKRTLTETVANWEAYLPRQAVLPHPSPRNQHWLRKNPWFESDALPAIQARVREVLAG